MKRSAKQRVRDGLRLIHRLGVVPSPPRLDRWWRFARDAVAYVEASGSPISVIDLFPVLGEQNNEAGLGRGHYFCQDLWAARVVRDSKTKRHVDVGSRVDGFIAHCSLLTAVEYVDLRPLASQIPNVQSVRGSILELPYADKSLPSVSSLHVIEHIGLGRYGDPIDPKGTDRAIAELQRVVAPGGNLLIGCPIGRERICFNAHRVLAPDHVIREASELDLVSFSAVDDNGELVSDADPADFTQADYACGLYHLRRRA